MLHPGEIKPCVCLGSKEGIYIERGRASQMWRVTCGFCMRSTDDHVKMSRAVKEWNEKYGKKDVAPKIPK